MCTDSLTILYVKKITVRCAWLVHEKMKDCQTQNILPRNETLRGICLFVIEFIYES